MAIFSDLTWQMSLGERAAIVGVLAELQPDLAIEIGTAEGSSMRVIATHCKEVHSFDLLEPSLDVPENVTLHTGDSHELLSRLLKEFAAAGRNVDFVLVDGDHSAHGVKLDLEDLLNSPAIANTTIVIHDTSNEEVRRGVEAVPYPAWPKVDWVELDWVPGILYCDPELFQELWNGLGLIRVNASRSAYASHAVMQDRYYPAAHLLADARDVVLHREATGEHIPYADLVEQLAEAKEHIERGYREARAPLEQELADVRQSLGAELEETRAQLDQARRVLSSMSASFSWKLTVPLRRLKASARRRLT